MEGFTRERLKNFYERVFPCDDFCKWIGNGDKGDLSKREISMTLYDARDPEGIYLRWCSYKNSAEFKAGFTVRIDWAVFTAGLSFGQQNFMARSTLAYHSFISSLESGWQLVS